MPTRSGTEQTTYEPSRTFSRPRHAPRRRRIGHEVRNGLQAVRGVRDHRFSYYDAQIWATALLNQIQVVFSEDFNPSRIEGVRFVNPFADEFDCDEWI